MKIFLIFFPWFIPIRTFTFWAHHRLFPSFGNPIMSTSFTFTFEDFYFFNTHRSKNENFII